MEECSLLAIKSQSVVDALLQRISQLHIEVKTNSPVKTIHYEDGHVKSVQFKEW